MTVKVIFSSGCCSFLYTAFAALIAYRGLNTILAAAKYIKIIISGIIVAVIIAFIHQLGSLSNNNLNFTLIIQSILLSLLMVEIIYKIIKLFNF